MSNRLRCAFLGIGAAVALSAESVVLRAQAPADYGPVSADVTEITYPHPVSTFPFVFYGKDVRMAYMDVPPAGQANNRTVVLFHGMNFGGFYFGGPIEALRHSGFRVIVPAHASPKKLNP